MEAFDCEALSDGLLLQPINTWSSLGFLVAAAVVWRFGHRPGAAFIALAGAGSIWFHASASDLATVVHDIGVSAAALAGIWQLVTRIRSGQVPYVAITVFAVGVVIWSQSRTGGPLCQPDALLQWHAVWHVLAAWAYVVLFWQGDGHGH